MIRHDLSITSSRQSLTAGFTLIEILVALAVIAIAMTALLASTARMARQQQQLEQLSFAGWLADTAMTETRLRDPFPKPGTREGKGKSGPYEFRWTLVVQATPEPAIRRLDLHVYAVDAAIDSAPVVSLIGFAGQ